MLELRKYSYADLSAYLGSNDNQAIERKLNSYGIQFSEDGRGQNRTYTITDIPDRFRVFCVFDLGLDPRTNFIKLRDFLFFLLGDDDFNWRPMEMMEEYLRIEGRGISRQTIAKYIEKLEKIDLIHPGGEIVYYKVFKRFGVQEHEIITKDEYCGAWKIYWDCRNKGYESGPAFSCMYNRLGGSPHKQHRIEQNGVNAEILNTLAELVAESYLGEIEND